MSATIRMYDRSVIARRDRLDGRVQHRVHKLGVRARADRPTDDQAVEAIDYRRQIYLAGGNLKWSKRQGVVELSPYLSSPNRTCPSQRIRLSI